MKWYPGHLVEIMYRVRNIRAYAHPAFDPKLFIWRYTFGQYQDNDCADGFRCILRLRRTGAQIYVDKVRRLSRRQLIGDSRSGGDSERVPDNVLFFSRIQGNNHERRDWIPNQHPIELMKFIVALSCSGNEEIVDLCGGSGSTLRAAKDLGINCTSVDISKSYCDLLRVEMG